MDEYHLLYFQEDEVLLCGGYLVAWRIAVGGAQCFFKKDTSRFKASNFYYHEPKESSESKRYCESKPYYLLFMYEDTLDASIIRYYTVLNIQLFDVQCVLHELGLINFLKN